MKEYQTNKPRVSIVIPVYNGANYLHQAIDSALAQTYQNVEIIVVNDGSNDGGKTQQIALSYGDKIRYFWKENGGVASALNLGIEKMTGEFFSWLSHDDIYLPNKIEREVDCFLSKDNANTIVFSAYQTIDQNGEVLENYRLPPGVYTNIPGLISIDTERSLNGCSMLIPRKILEEDRFDERLRYTQDYDLWLRLSKRIVFEYLDEFLFQSRQHPEQDSRAGGEKVLLEADRFRSRSISELDPQRALDYVENKISELEKIDDIYRVNGYIAAHLCMRMLILKCLILRYEKDEASAWNTFLNVQESQEGRNWYEQESDKPTLVIYNNVWTYGGVERVMSLLIPKFIKRYRVILITDYIAGEKGYDLPEETIHLVLKQESELTIPERISAICKLVDAKIFLGNPNIIDKFLPVYKLLFLLGVKTVALNHYYYFLPQILPQLQHINDLRRKALPYADAAVWLTSFSAAMCGCWCDHVAVIPNPNTYPVGETRNYPKQKQILVVGRFFDSLKRIDRVMKVFSEVLQRDQSVKLIVLGNCHGLNDFIPAPVGMTIQEAMDAAHVPEQMVIFAGEQADVRKYYNNSSVLLMCSECEGFGMVLTEAGTFGVPVVVYGTPGLEDLIVDGDNGYLIMDNSPASAAESILHIINDECEWLRMSQNAQALAERFTIDKIVNKWFDLFDIITSDQVDHLEDRFKAVGIGYSNTIPAEQVYTILERNEIGYCSSFAPVTSKTKQMKSKDEEYRQKAMVILNSHSWAITRPLREAKKYYDKVNKKLRKAGRGILCRLNSQSEAERMMSECRQLVDDCVRTQEKLKAENTRLLSVLNRVLASQDQMHVQSALDQEEYEMVWYQKWQSLENSLSWRITKPLRSAKKYIVSLKNRENTVRRNQ